MAQEWPKVAEGSPCEHRESSCDCAQDDGRGEQHDGDAARIQALTSENKRTPASSSLARVQ